MFVIFISVTIFNAQYICANEPVIVHTQYGNVSGYQTELARVFYGIPFAQPPIGTLRLFLKVLALIFAYYTYLSTDGNPQYLPLNGTPK